MDISLEFAIFRLNWEMSDGKGIYMALDTTLAFDCVIGRALWLFVTIMLMGFVLLVNTLGKVLL